MNSLFLLCCAALIISLVVIFYQDLKERQVSLWVLLLFGLTTVMSVVCFKGLTVLLYNTLGITLYLSFIWLMLKIYLYIKFKKNVVILNNQLGAADAIVILCIGLTFNLIGMILFFCFGFIFSLIAFLALFQFKKDQNVKFIPLAGFLAFFYMVVIIILNLIPLNLIECSFVKP